VKEKVNTFRKESGINFMPKVTPQASVLDNSIMKQHIDRQSTNLRESQESRFSTLQPEKELTLPSALEKPAVKSKFNFKAARRINM